MDKAFDLKTLDNKIEEIKKMIANEQDEDRKKKLEEELESLYDLRTFVIG